jgi:hypothetical protein
MRKLSANIGEIRSAAWTRHGQFFNGLASDQQLIWVGFVLIITIAIGWSSAYYILITPGPNALHSMQYLSNHFDYLIGLVLAYCGVIFALLLGVPCVWWVVKWVIRSIREVCTPQHR